MKRIPDSHEEGHFQILLLLLLLWLLTLLYNYYYYYFSCCPPAEAHRLENWKYINVLWNGIHEAEKVWSFVNVFWNARALPLWTAIEMRLNRNWISRGSEFIVVILSPISCTNSIASEFHRPPVSKAKGVNLLNVFACLRRSCLLVGCCSSISGHSCNVSGQTYLVWSHPMLMACHLTRGLRLHSAAVFRLFLTNQLAPCMLESWSIIIFFIHQHEACRLENFKWVCSL